MEFVMAWKEIRVEEQRKSFIDAYLEERLTMAELCRQFGISRTIGYKWAERFNQEGYEGLIDRSRARIHQSHATNPIVIQDILKIKFEYPEWGPKKIYADLRRKYYLEKSTLHCPSSTTIGKILESNGLVNRRKYRKRFPTRTSPLAHAIQPNEVWSVDFKGWSLTKDGRKIEPFTLIDNSSRYLLKCLQLDVNDAEHVWSILDNAFREFGLPKYLRSDNGPPFATSGAGRLSKLSVRLIKAGVIPEWTEPGNPQQNGRHERMHSTLKREAIFSDLTLEEQKMQLQAFYEYYNFRRPHEALEQNTPGSIYIPSSNHWCGRLKVPEYPDSYIKLKVHPCGKIWMKNNPVYIARSLENEYIGIAENKEVYFGPIKLGLLKDNILIIERRSGRRKKRNL